MNGPTEPTTEARQRWRLVVRRGPAARGMPQREIEEAWAAGLLRCGLPLTLAGGRGAGGGGAGGRPRPRLLFAAPVPVGLTAEQEPLDLYLSARMTIAEVRERLTDALPPGHELVDLHDVWVGAPSLAGSLVAADYRAVVDVDPAGLGAAAAGILAAKSLRRAGRKGDPAKAYDLRPLILRLEVRTADPGPAADGGGAPAGHPASAPGRPARAEIRMRLRHDQEAGVGRPDEVLAALGAAAGLDLSRAEVARERLLLAGDDVVANDRPTSGGATLDRRG